MKCVKCGSPLPSDSKICTYCGSAQESGPKKEGTPRPKLRFLPWCIALAAVILLGVVLLQGRSLRAQNTRLEAQVAELTRSGQDQQIRLEAMQQEASDLRFAARQYEHICRELQNCDIGFSSVRFRSYDSVILVDMDDRDRKFTLVANWDEPGTVQVAASSDAATVSFDESEWEENTTLTVHPRYPGATVLTFTNTVNSDRFKVLILVTE